MKSFIHAVSYTCITKKKPALNVNPPPANSLFVTTGRGVTTITKLVSSTFHCQLSTFNFPSHPPSGPSIRPLSAASFATCRIISVRGGGPTSVKIAGAEKLLSQVTTVGQQHTHLPPLSKIKIFCVNVGGKLQDRLTSGPLYLLHSSQLPDIFGVVETKTAKLGRIPQIPGYFRFVSLARGL